MAPHSTCDPVSSDTGMKQRKPEGRSDHNGCEEDGLPTQPSAIQRRVKARTASVDSNDSEDAEDNSGRLRRSNSFKHLAEDSCSSFLDRDDDEEISFHPDAVIQDDQSVNGSDSKQSVSPKRKSSDEKVLEDNIHYYQYEVCKGKTRSNKTFDGEDESDGCKKTEDFQNNFLKFLEQNNIKREGPPEGRTRHKSGPSIGSKPRGKRKRTTSSCGRLSPKSDEESGRGSRISINGSEDESSSSLRGRNSSRSRKLSSSRSRSRKRSSSRLELNPLYSPSPSETGSNADSSVSNFSIKKLSVEITRLPGILTPEPCLDSDIVETDDSADEEDEPCTRTTRSAKTETKPEDGESADEEEDEEEEEEEPSPRTTRSAKVQAENNEVADNEGGDTDNSDDDEEEEACLRTTRSRLSSETKPETKSPKRTRRSELDKLFEAGVSSFHCESAAAERKRLSDLGTPLNIDCSDSCESEVNSVTSAKRKLSDICDSEPKDSRKKSKKTSASSRPGARAKNIETSDSDNISNNGNNLLKTISPARSKGLGQESEEEDDDDGSVWEGWDRLEEELNDIDSDPVDPDSVYCSFEHTPSHEGWFQTYSRQDRGDEIMFYPDIVGAPFLLPYEMSYASFLPNKSALSQSIASSSGTATPIRTAKLQQDRLVARSKTSSQADRGSRRGTPRGGTPARSVADDNVKGKKSIERKVSVSESEHSTDSDGSRKGKFKFGPKSKHLLDLNPRISPRCHASTKALLNAGSVGDEDELADFLLMEEMSEGVQGRYPFVAHDESSNDSTFSSVSQAGKSKIKSESIGEYMALAASLDRVLRQPDPELLTEKNETPEKPSCSKDVVDKGKIKNENAATATRSRISSEQLLSPKNKKDKTKKKKTILGEAPMDLIVARAVDGVLLDCLEDELPTVPFDDCVPGSDIMSLLSDYKSCDSMAVCNARWLRPKCGGAQLSRSLAANKEKSRRVSPARPKIIYKEDSDADVETTDADSVSVSSFGSESSRRRPGKKRKVNMTGFPSPKKKKINSKVKEGRSKIIEQDSRIVMPRKNKDKVPYRPKGFMEKVQNTVLEAAKTKSKKAVETPSKSNTSEKTSKVKSETSLSKEKKQPKIEKFLKRSPKVKEEKKSSPATSKMKTSPRRKSDDGAKRIGKRSKTGNYREQESDTESIFEAANMSPRSLKVPYRSKEFKEVQQAMSAANSSSKSAKVDKANKSLKKSLKKDKKMTRSKR